MVSSLELILTKKTLTFCKVIIEILWQIKLLYNQLNKQSTKKGLTDKFLMRLLRLEFKSDFTFKSYKISKSKAIVTKILPDYE